MFQAFINMWRVKELRNKLLFTLGMMAIYRIGFHIPLPAVDQSSLAEWARNAAGGAAGNLIAYMGIFTGGALSQSTVKMPVGAVTRVRVLVQGGVDRSAPVAKAARCPSFAESVSGDSATHGLESIFPL